MFRSALSNGAIYYRHTVHPLLLSYAWLLRTECSTIVEASAATPCLSRPPRLRPYVVAVPLQLPIAIVQEHATRWGRVRKSATTVRSEQERPLALAGSSCTRTLETEFELI